MTYSQYLVTGKYRLISASRFQKHAISTVTFQFSVNQDYLRYKNGKSERYGDFPRNQLRICKSGYLSKTSQFYSKSTPLSLKSKYFSKKHFEVPLKTLIAITNETLQAIFKPGKQRRYCLESRQIKQAFFERQEMREKDELR